MLRQKTQKEVAASVGISQAKLSKAENGLQKLPDDAMQRLADYYGLPMAFFVTTKAHTPVGHYYYRKRLNIPDKVIDALEAKVQIIKNIIDSIMSSIEIPDFNLTTFVDDDETPAEKARKLRYELKVFRGPIHHLATLLENNGIIIFKTDFGTDKIDGLTTFTPSNRKIIFLNNKMPNDRIRFSLAHELGHLVMHLDKPPLSSEDAEREADEFASEFLMPELEIKEDFKYINFNTLGQLKRKWGVSMRALVRRAFDIGKISKDTYRNMQINFSKKGYNKCEPILLPIDEPTLLKDTISLYKEELDYSDADLQQLMKIGEKDYNDWFTSNKKYYTLHTI